MLKSSRTPILKPPRADKEYEIKIVTEQCDGCKLCVEFCPDDNVLQLQYAGYPVFKSSKEYFKKRNKDQRNWEKTTWADVAPK